MTKTLTSKGMQVSLLFGYILNMFILVCKSLHLIVGVECVKVIYTVYVLQYIPLKPKL
jgi:hypothetical protein